MADSTSIVAERVLTPDGWVHHARVHLAGGRVTGLEPTRSGPDVAVLAPGFVDLQVNGIDDIDVAHADGGDWERLDALLLAQGVTAWCPTLISSPLADYGRVLDRITAAQRRALPGVRPTLIGAHLEGPFLGAAPGAHPPHLVRDPDLAWLRQLPPVVRLVTLGAEHPDAPAATDLLTRRGIVVSLGHTTAGDAQLDAVDRAGAAMVTHLFNAMSGLHHRQPGVAAWALAHPTLAVSLIADGVHVHPRMLALAFGMLGPDRAVLVTDAVAWRSSSVGTVTLSTAEGAPRLADGTLAGSMLTMDVAVRTCVAAGVPLEHAVRAASAVPARVMGLTDRGVVAVGRRADLVALDDHLQVAGVWVGGQRVRTGTLA